MEAMGIRAGMVTALVLTGVTRAADLERIQAAAVRAVAFEF